MSCQTFLREASRFLYNAPTPGRYLMSWSLSREMLQTGLVVIIKKNSLYVVTYSLELAGPSLMGARQTEPARLNLL